MVEDPVTAAQAQAAVHEVRRGLAARVACSPLRHELLGLLAGGYLVVQAGPIWMSLTYFIAFLAVLALVVLRMRRRKGFWINGWRRGRTRRVVAPFLIAWLGILVVTIWGARIAHLVWAPFLGGAVAAAVVTLFGYAWERVYRDEMALEA